MKPTTPETGDRVGVTRDRGVPLWRGGNATGARLRPGEEVELLAKVINTTYLDGGTYKKSSQKGLTEAGWFPLADKGGAPYAESIVSAAWPPAAAGVLLVTEDPCHGPCLVVLANKGRLDKDGQHLWEFPWGTFEAPEHSDLVDTAVAELFEETCGLVRGDRSSLTGAPAIFWPTMTFRKNGTRPGMYAAYGLRIDNVSPSDFMANRARILKASSVTHVWGAKPRSLRE